MLTPPLPWDRPQRRGEGGRLVVLLHGLWRGWHAMEPLARMLREEGFSTLNIPYPSARLPIPVLAERVAQTIRRDSNGQAACWITHSLGGIIARHILADPDAPRPQRLIMLAPPNSGSEIVDWADGHPLIRQLLGPAGRALGTSGVPAELPPLPTDIEAAVVMGRRSSIPFFRKLLDTENDGIVSANRGRIHGLKDFRVVDADHTFIQTHPDTVRFCIEFLTAGR